MHRLYWVEKWPIRKIERHLHLSWRTIAKYLEHPAQTPARRPRASKLDDFKDAITDLLAKHPKASAAVIAQRLRPLGYQGGGSILRACVRAVRPLKKQSRAFARMEPLAGERFEVDWGHFGSLDSPGNGFRAGLSSSVNREARLRSRLRNGLSSILASNSPTASLASASD